MDVIKSDVRKLVNKELNAANKRFRPFASPHEGQNIVREELEEVEQELMPLELNVKKRMWNAVKAKKKKFRRKNFKKSVKWRSIWQWKRFR